MSEDLDERLYSPHARLNDPRAPEIRLPEAVLTILTRVVTAGQIDVDPTGFYYGLFVEAGGYGNQDFWTEAGWAWRKEQNITQPLWRSGRSLSRPPLPIRQSSEALKEEDVCQLNF